jgi:SAM-dependent methyltransferase
MLARRGRVLGLDLDPRAVGTAAPRYPGASFGVADLCHLPVASAETIVALQVIEHLWCPAEFVAACARALSPEGLLLVSTPNAETFPTGVNPSHTHEYTAAELGGLLGTAFARVELLGLRHWSALRRLDRVLGGSVQRRLISTPYDDLPRTARARLHAIRARHFRIGADPSASLDLLAICRDARQLPSAP